MVSHCKKKKKRKKTEKRNKKVAAAKNEVAIKTQFNQGKALSMKGSWVWAK